MTHHSFQERIRACWLGKNIGGTLGGPVEGRRGPLDLDFYRPVPTEPMPNDDLDLQVVWLHYLLAGGHREVTPDLLAEAWARHVKFPFDEYGIVARNEAYGVKGRARGTFDNFFSECMGGAIRSELWACVAPGNPRRAAGLAWADASVDHAGEGVYAEMFHAALQAAAFTVDDREKLIEIGLEFVPPDSRLGRALRDTQRWWAAERDWLKVRARVLDTYDVGNFTDVVPNLCFELIGWYAGEGDFGRSICIAVNCGLDTDCTGATLGALLGILDPDCIPARWVEPIGEHIVLSKEIVGVPVPRDIDHLTEMTLRLGEQLAGFSAPIGEVLPAAPQRDPNEFVAIPVQVADVDKDFQGEVDGAGMSWSDTVLHGHWTRWFANDFQGDAKVLKMTVEVTDSLPVKLLVASPGGARAWVDGIKVIDYSAADFSRDPFTAPALHRAGVAAAIFGGERSLMPGIHQLVVAIDGPGYSPHLDLVIGLGDSRTNLWLPWGIAPPPVGQFEIIQPKLS